LKYYTLKNPDDVMDDSTCIDNLTDDQKNKTQKVIEQIIGSYDNFQRIISTTSDTLNKVLSNDMAEFIDSLLYDSGLDIFDRKLTEFKEFEKNKNSRIRVNCDVEKTKASIRDYEQKNVELVGKIKEHEDTLIPEKEQKIKIGWEFVEKLNKRLYNIDNEVYNLNVDLTKEKILLHKKNISDFRCYADSFHHLCPATHGKTKCILQKLRKRKIG
jgi:molecular chaperone GrpE (heat shock protein)